MELRELQMHLISLANQVETDVPFVNCYLNLESGIAGCRKTLNESVCLLKKKVDPECIPAFWEAVGQIEAALGLGFHPASKGTSIFARGGDRPFLLLLQFGAPLPNSISLSMTPHLYHLVELADNYHRFVVLLSSESAARILEVNLGTMTEAKSICRPELRKRTGREFTREHYQCHRTARTVQFVNEQVRSLDQVLSAGCYRHLILAGDPRLTSRIQKALPKHLMDALVTAIRISSCASAEEILTATTCAFLEHEEKESLSVVCRLGQELNTGGSAVAGTHACLQAVNSGNGRILVMGSAYTSALGWLCSCCGQITVDGSRPPLCSQCSGPLLREISIKEQMVLTALRKGCSIEIVEDRDAMEVFAGVGCILRHSAPGWFRKPAA
jgi:hypothetical protein